MDGDIVQHIEYVPFGEVFIEERNSKWNTPYLFNAKELDEETGLYYYGARYYDPRTRVWLSTDPLQEKYPNVSTYTYCFLSPVRYFDPTGEGSWDDIVAWGNRNNVGTRTWGGIKMISGGIEAFVGGTFAVAALETGVGFVVGAGVFVHGSDVASSGFRQMMSGQDESSLTSEGLQAVGLSKQNAELVDAGISILGTMGTSYLTNTSKIPSLTSTGNKILSSGNKVEIFGGKSSQLKGFTNYDIAAESGIADDVANFGKHFHNGSVSQIVANNPQAVFLESVSSSLEKGGSIIVRGNMSNKYFNKIWKGTADGLSNYQVISKQQNVLNNGYKTTAGNPIYGQINEIILMKK